MSLHFPETWMNDSFTQFITQLTEKLGFSEIEYVPESSSLKEDIPDSTNPVFNKLKKFFLEHTSIRLVMMNSNNFYGDICNVSRKKFIESTNPLFNLFVQFLFTIQNGVATPHHQFNLHVGHFVLAFMKVIGASLEGIHVQTVIKSGPDWISGKNKQNIVCSSVATGRKCRNGKCMFLHVANGDYGIISLHTGIVMVICQGCSRFDKVPNAKSVLKPLLDSFVSFGVAGGCSAESETRAVAGGGSFRAETCAVADGCSVESEPHAVAGGCSFRAETRAVADGCSAKPEPHVVAHGGSFRAETRAVAGGGSFRAETCAVAGGGSFRAETRAVAGGCSAKSEPLAVAGGGDEDDEDYDPNDPLIQLLFFKTSSE